MLVKALGIILLYIERVVVGKLIVVFKHPVFIRIDTACGMPLGWAAMEEERPIGTY